jgi:hypothetical protein
MDDTQIIDTIKQRLRSKVPEFVSYVLPIYKLLNWTWNNKGSLNVPFIPTAKDIEEVLYSLIDDIESISTIRIACGGVYVFILVHKDSDSIRDYGLGFCIEDIGSI